MKSKFKFYQRKLGHSLEGDEKRLSNLAIGIVVLSGLVYIVISAFILTQFYRHQWYFRNLGGIFIFGLIISAVGVGFLINRNPKYRIVWSMGIFLFMMLFSVFQFYYFEK